MNMEPKNHLNWNPETPLPNLYCWGGPAINFPGFLLGMLKLSRFNFFGKKPAIFHSTLGAPDIWWQRATNPLPDGDLWVPPRWVANRRTQPGGWLVPGGLGTGDKLISFLPQFPGVGRFYVPILRRIPEESFLGFYRKKEMGDTFWAKKNNVANEWHCI